MAAFQKLKSGNGRVLIRRKGAYTPETVKRRGDAEEWAMEMECRVDHGESVSAKRHLNKLNTTRRGGNAT